MFKWIEDFREASPKTKNFIYTAIIFSGIIILSSIYCYVRLDYVRSYKQSQQQTEQL